MPRLKLDILRKAAALSKFLPPLLPQCRTITDAISELRWLVQHISPPAPATLVSLPLPRLLSSLDYNQLTTLARLVERRRKGEPLQYIIGTQPFGPLMVGCRVGVLIPRGETEAYTFYLAERLRGDSRLVRDRERAGESPMRVVDFCTGTGCITLGLYSGLHKAIPHLQVTGYDISPVALSLSIENLHAAVHSEELPPSALTSITFKSLSLFAPETLFHPPIDILISNPPYISHTSYASPSPRGLTLSTHRYEPKLALVPLDDIPRSPTTRHEDAFYERLLIFAEKTQARVVLFEVGDEVQAVAVMKLVSQSPLFERTRQGGKAEIWRDWPDMQPEESEKTSTSIPGVSEWTVPIRGAGNMRSVYLEIPPKL